MGYFTIDKYHVFYSDEKFEEINEKFYKNISAVDSVVMNMRSSDGKYHKKFKELKKIQYKTIKDEFKKLPIDKFIEKWVIINYTNKEAQDKSWEIIYDYFHITKNGYISDNRDQLNIIIDDYDNPNYCFPQGEIIRLNFFLNPHNNFLNIFKRKQVARSINYNLKKIIEIKGHLSSLVIRSEENTLILDKTRKILRKNAN